ncbi:MAG: hypothetical protein AB8I08_06065 [Sandaracinaceae bacterium]
MTWTEIVIPVEESPQLLLLERVLAPLVEAHRNALAAWHYFWEPDLWIRLRWKGEPPDLSAWLDAAVEDGRLPSWSLGSYAGDAKQRGVEMWERCERDFQNGAEYAMRLHSLAREGKLTRERDFHWARHVHCFSNQLVGTWSEEARLCVELARYRVGLLSRARVNAPMRDRMTAILESLDDVLKEADTIAEAERNVTSRWRAEGRPDIVSLFDLPEE